MPTYEYVCTACGAKLEELQKMSDAPLTFCSKCKKDTLKRVPGKGIGLNFSGSGYYSTDYHGKKPGGSCGCGKTSCNN
ncbi:MAG: FmdB family zinc ribbon protein [Parachlamydiaceae bacterium]